MFNVCQTGSSPKELHSCRVELQTERELVRAAGLGPLACPSSGPRPRNCFILTLKYLLISIFCNSTLQVRNFFRHLPVKHQTKLFYQESTALLTGLEIVEDEVLSVWRDDAMDIGILLFINLFVY